MNYLNMVKRKDNIERKAGTGAEKDPGVKGAAARADSGGDGRRGPSQKCT